MKYLVRLKGSRQYLWRAADLARHLETSLDMDLGPQWWSERNGAVAFDNAGAAWGWLRELQTPDPDLSIHAGRVVRLLSHEEACRKRAAVELRRFAREQQGDDDEGTRDFWIDDALKRADELWPAKDSRQ